MIGGKTLNRLSIVLFVIGGLFIIAGFADVDLLFVGILILAGGIVLNRIAKKMKAKSDRYKQYLAFIVNQGLTSIDSIAGSVGVSYEQAIKEIQTMIDAGYFHGSYIDHTNRSFVLIHPSQPVMQAPQGQQNQMQPRVVVCPGCGANNTIFGAIGECEYCASPLS